MNCAIHTDVEATGYCRNCGQALCVQCARAVRGALYCESCLSSIVARPTPPAVRIGTNPWVAFGLGWIPGLGAVCNGEYIKALVHVGIFAGLVTLNARGADQPLWGLVLAAFICYMPIEAYIVARDRSRNRQTAEPPVISEEHQSTHLPIGPIVLIALGALFLLDNLHVLPFDWIFENAWPVLLIGAGAWLLWKRTR
jgi:hypothetical protein